ncbi:MAG: polysaccharide deacetylase family protein [Leptolyngbya sp. SIO3F4]|nr:polysaccharide deacetylase family protein [Leptolyngbya sp. SIO3F4]
MLGTLRKYKRYYKMATSRSSLCYHSICGDTEPQAHTHEVSFRVFKKQVLWMQRSRNLVAANSTSWQSVSNPVAVTFDDAYLNILDEALPFLMQRGIPVTVFANASTLEGKSLWRDELRLVLDVELESELVQRLPSDWGITTKNLYFRSKSPQINSSQFEEILSAFVIEKGLGRKNRLYMNQEELRQLSSESGFTIGNHSLNHYVLSSLSKVEQKKEIEQGGAALRALDVEVSDFFAAPFGNYNTVNQDTLNILDSLGYKGLLLTNGMGPVDRSQLNLSDRGLTVTNRYLPPNA